MNSIAQQYLHIQCAAYALLIDAAFIEEVVSVGDALIEGTTFHWREENIPLVDLCKLLIGKQAKSHRDCLILKLQVDTEATYQYLAVAVEAVLNIEAIKEEEFSNIPNLAFTSNDYFDRAYMHVDTQQCIYRVRKSALISFLAE